MERMSRSTPSYSGRSDSRVSSSLIVERSSSTSGFYSYSPWSCNSVYQSRDLTAPRHLLVSFRKNASSCVNGPRGFSAPVKSSLNKFTYSYSERTFNNIEGYTWTPYSLRFLLCSKESTFPAKVYIRNHDSKESCTKVKIPPIQPQLQVSRSWIWDKEVLNQSKKKMIRSYSEFMRSPYLKNAFDLQNNARSNSRSSFNVLQSNYKCEAWLKSNDSI